MFGALSASEDSAIEALLDVARDFTPRFEICGVRNVVLDLSGLARLCGHPRAIGHELRRAAGARGVRVRVAIAGTRTAARLLAIADSWQSAVGSRQEETRNGLLPTARCPLPTDVIVIESGAEAAAVASLPLTLLPHVANDPPPLCAHELSAQGRVAMRPDGSVLAGRSAFADRPGEASPKLAESNQRRAKAGPNAPNDPNDLLTTFRRWGLRTLGDLAALPADAVAARLGTDGVRWHRLAQGRDLRPLRPAVPDERFEQALDLEWPIEGLEPLSFVLGRLIEPLTAHLERRGRGAAVLHLRLHLVTRGVHERSLQLPAPMRDARTLRTLLLLDLESHPPPAAIDRVVVAADPTPARVLQFSLLTRPLPSPGQLSTLAARLSALMGEGRCGSPAVVDSWQPGACAITPFTPSDPNAIHSNRPRRLGGTETKCSDFNHLRVSVSPWPVAVKDASNEPVVALRRFRFPVPARVRVEHDTPIRVVTDRRGLTGGRVEKSAGPWRTSGGWWCEYGPRSRGVTEENQKNLRVSVSPWPVAAWDHDEWDVTLGDGATYRIFRDRTTDAWFLEGVYD